MASTNKPLTFHRILRRIQYQKILYICVLIFVGYECISFFSSTSPSFSGSLITADELKEKLQTNTIRIIDATYIPRADLPDQQEYRAKYYGNFELLFKYFNEDEYVQEHIPGAVLLNMDIGFHFNQFKRYDVYPPEVGQQLLRLLGINNGDIVVVYGRGPMAGMLFAAHIWWLLKYYGIEEAYVLNGGLDAWKKAGNPVTSKFDVVEPGNFVAKPNSKLSVSFDELVFKDTNGKSLIDRFETINVFDARPFDQYAGGLKMYNPSANVGGTHIRGAKSLPVMQIVNENGLLPAQTVRQALDKAGFVPGKPVIVYCNSGSQASLLFLALYDFGVKDIKLYQGGMNEMMVRDPGQIS
uniref:Sulfurtransferase n=1 Tax=Syphacia muris TaxID=451379 RepID=A0A0N5ALQ4_9BILA